MWRLILAENSFSADNLRVWLALSYYDFSILVAMSAVLLIVNMVWFALSATALVSLCLGMVSFC